MNTTKSIPYSKDMETTAVQSFITRVYGWMAIGLAITGFVAMWVASSPQLINLIYSRQIVFIGLIIIELILVARLVRIIQRITSQRASLIFVFYSILNGLTLSAIFLVYTQESLASTFLITAGTFGVTSLYGYLTKTDLTKLGNLLFMALIGLIIASLINWFLKSEMLYWITTYAGVLIFVGLTAYDTQKIKKIGALTNGASEEGKKASIIGALTLYLDFINMFLFLLRIFGRRN